MAQTVTLTCDRIVRAGRGKNPAPHGIPVEDQQPTEFMVMGEYRRADLCIEHRAELQAALEPWMDISEPFNPRHPSNVRKVLAGRGEVAFTTADVRKWLQEQGKEVPTTGRISKSLIEEFKHAHRIPSNA